MSDERRLQDKLSELASTSDNFGTKGRALSPVPGAGYLGAILREIDDTILARQLEFENDRGALVTIEVSDRRLMRLTKLSAANELVAHQELVGLSTVDAESNKSAALSTMFTDFLAKSDNLYVTSSKSAGAHSAADIGCSVQVLAAAWRIGMYGENAPDLSASLAGFVGYCQDLSLAWLLEDQDGSPEKTGEPGELELLEALSKMRLSFDARVVGGDVQNDSPPYCVVLASDLPMQRCVICVQTSGARLVCLIPVAEMAAVVAAWHRRD